MSVPSVWIMLSEAWEAVTRGAASQLLQERLLRDALRDGQIASAADYAHVGGPVSNHPSATKRDWKLGEEFWRFADINWPNSAATRRQLSYEYEPEKTRQLSQVEALGIRVSKNDLVECGKFSSKFDASTAVVPIVPSPPRRKGPGGRGGDFEWEKCLVEAARWMHIEGVPSKQADLIRRMAEWFGEDGPGETQLKEHLGPLYLALKTGDPAD